MITFKFHSWLAGLLLLIAGYLWGHAGWMLAKAQLAQWLIAVTWQQQLHGGIQHPPWPWADTWPIARMQVPRLSIDQYVLEGAQGNSLAFGPGHSIASASPGSGTVVISGHRDTHFRYLRHLRINDLIRIQSNQGQWLTYRITDQQVVDSEVQPLTFQRDRDQLILITCYPFDSLLQGPLRYRITAVRA